MFEWRQERNKVFVKEPKGEIYFVVPDDFSLKDTNPDLLKLVEYTLFSPYYKDEFKKSKLEKHNWTRKKGKNIGHSLSTGADSTAAMLLLPEDTILFYHERSEYLGGQMDQSNALNMIEKMDKKVHISKSDNERVNIFHGKIRGSFSTDFACCAGLILLADYLDLGYISTGTMLGSTYVRKGWAYQDFGQSEYWTRWSYLFKKVGLELMFPVGGASEVITNKLVQNSKYKDLAYSCIRGSLGKECRLCYKCFRKGLLNNIPQQMSEEVFHYLETKPLKQGDSMIYAMQKSGVDIPLLKEYNEIDVSWSERFYEMGLELVPDEFRKYIVSKIIESGIQFMNEKDVKSMKEFNIK